MTPISSSPSSAGLATSRDFALCRGITEAHGHTYALATKILDFRQRRAVWALYAWARIVDDYVDCTEHSGCRADQVEETVRGLSRCLQETITAGRLVVSSLPDVSRPRDFAVISAAAQTFIDFDIAPTLAEDFVVSMLMDVPDSTGHIAHFDTWEQLEGYMWGSAAVIGLEMMPILGTREGIARAEAEPFAADLGRAFQVTNFLRDIAEDLDRGRIYIPLQEWSAFGVEPDELYYCAAEKRATRRVRRALAFAIARNRAIYRAAEPGIGMLDSPGRQAIRAAFVLYSDILTEIERADYNVFGGRARVGTTRRVSVALPLAAAGLLASFNKQGPRE